MRRFASVSMRGGLRAAATSTTTLAGDEAGSERRDARHDRLPHDASRLSASRAQWRRAVARRLRRTSRPALCCRALRHAASQRLPLCARRSLHNVVYLFGPRLPKSGRCVADQAELRGFDARAEHYTSYEVEVCVACEWNHLLRARPHGGTTRFRFSGAVHTTP